MLPRLWTSPGGTEDDCSERHGMLEPWRHSLTGPRLGGLDAAPDDGNRCEVLDGALVVTPPPRPAHQTVFGELFVVLGEAARPRRLRVIMAPLAWRIGPGQVPEPDLMVLSPEAVGDRVIEVHL